MSLGSSCGYVCLVSQSLSLSLSLPLSLLLVISPAGIALIFPIPFEALFNILLVKFAMWDLNFFFNFLAYRKITCTAWDSSWQPFEKFWFTILSSSLLIYLEQRFQFLGLWTGCDGDWTPDIWAFCFSNLLVDCNSKIWDSPCWYGNLHMLFVPANWYSKSCGLIGFSKKESYEGES